MAGRIYYERGISLLNLTRNSPEDEIGERYSQIPITTWTTLSL